MCCDGVLSAKHTGTSPLAVATALMRSGCSIAMRCVMNAPIEKPVKKRLSVSRLYDSPSESTNASRNPESSTSLFGTNGLPMMVISIPEFHALPVGISTKPN